MIDEDGICTIIFLSDKSNISGGRDRRDMSEFE